MAFSNVTFTGSFSGSGSGQANGTSGTVTLSDGSVTAVLSEAADGQITGTYTYSGGSTVSNELGSEAGPAFSGGGTVSGTQAGLTFTSTSGPWASGSASISSDDTSITFSAPWTFSGGDISGSGTASGSLSGSPVATSAPTVSDVPVVPQADTWASQATGSTTDFVGPQFIITNAATGAWSLVSPPASGTTSSSWSAGTSTSSLAEPMADGLISAILDAVIPGEPGPIVEAMKSAQTAAGIANAELKYANSVFNALLSTPSAIASGNEAEIQQQLDDANTELQTDLKGMVLSEAVGTFFGGLLKNALWGIGDGAEFLSVELGTAPAFPTATFPYVITTAPVETVSNITASHGQSFTGSSLFKASLLGTAATEYDVWDTGTGGGHFVLNSTTLGANKDNIISTSQLAQLSYQSGSGADTLWVRGNDGTVWGPWSNAFTVTAPVDTGPTVQVTNMTATHGQSFAASSLFSGYSDPFNQTAAEYDFWDTGTGGGHFVLNSTTLGANKDNIIAASQLAQLSYIASSGAGTDTLWVRANDGPVWGPWSKSFTVSVPTPTLHVSSVSNSIGGEAFSLSSLVSVADPGNVGYQTLQLWDSDGTVAGGEFLINGVAQSGGHAINVPSGANVVFDAGTLGGPDTLWAQLIQNNGTASGWDKFVVTVPAPTLSVTSITNASRNGVIEISSLVTISDPGGVGYEMLELWDTETAGAVFVHNVAQPANTTIDVSPSNVASTAFFVGTLGGTDTLWARLEQNNGTLTAWEEFTVTAPMATLPSLVVTASSNARNGQSISLSSLITINDPSHVGYQMLQLWDSDGTVAGGEFLINGVAQTGGHAINVPSGANVVFDPGTSAGTDTLWAQLIQDNGTTTGWDKFTITVPNPTVAVQNFTTATPGQTIALSNLVTISDPGNVGYQKLELWDSDGTIATGQFMVGGVGQTGGHEIDVSPANVAGVVFDEGTSGNTDTLWARLMLNNSTVTAWQQFTVVDPVTVAQGATLELTNPYAGHAIFAGNAGTLQLDASAGFTGTVAGMTGSDTIDLRDIAFNPNPTLISALGYTANATNTGGTLSISDGTHLAQIALLGQYAASSFVTAGDGHGGTSIEPQTAPLPMLAQSQHA